MLGIEILLAVILILVGALGVRLAYFDNVPERPRWLYHGLTRRRRGLLLVYPPGIARLAGIAMLLYCVGLTAIAFNLGASLSGSNPPAWSSFGGWPLLLGVLLSIYVMLRLRRPPPPAD